MREDIYKKQERDKSAVCRTGGGVFDLKTDEKFMRLALVQAKKALALKEVPVGCVIVKDGKVISRAYNRKETDKNPLEHAEIRAIDKAVKKTGDWRLYGCTLYVTLEPCCMCAGAIVSARLMRTVFGAYEKNSGCAGSLYDVLVKNGLNHTVGSLGGVLENECSAILKDYFADKR